MEKDIAEKKLVDKAYAKIEELYSKPKSQKFILHLVHSFLPIEQWNVYLSTDKVCSITNLPGVNIKELSKNGVDDMFLIAKLELAETEKEKSKIREQINRSRAKLIKKYKVQEGENILETRRMYYSEKSDKLLCLPAIKALQSFAMNQIMLGNRAMNIAIKTKRFQSVKNVSKKEANVVAMKSEGYKLSEGNEQIFEKLRKRFTEK